MLCTHRSVTAGTSPRDESLDQCLCPVSLTFSSPPPVPSAQSALSCSPVLAVASNDTNSFELDFNRFSLQPETISGKDIEFMFSVCAHMYACVMYPAVDSTVNPVGAVGPSSIGTPHHHANTM